jgi:hypothetical protein
MRLDGFLIKGYHLSAVSTTYEKKRKLYMKRITREKVFKHFIG